jgi:Zn-finger nucleic acid-binding protein
MNKGLLDLFSKKLQPKIAETDRIIACPRCSRKMVKKTKHGVTIDKCTSCGGIWLDKGEIFKILNEVEKDKKENN